MNTLPSVIETPVWTTQIGGKAFTFQQFTAPILKTYVNRLTDALREAAQHAASTNQEELTAGEETLQKDTEFFLWLLRQGTDNPESVTREFVEDLTFSVRCAIMKGIEDLNQLEAQLDSCALLQACASYGMIKPQEATYSGLAASVAQERAQHPPTVETALETAQNRSETEG